ncbi:MAG: hypothetical protein LBC95_02675 [Candidatus Nomurabacteria bacterium]|jgi:hypothetical protein|nr:hypothetical protein [Candidatus Nomurabacteria bacterium]
MNKRKTIDVLIPHGYKPPKKDIDAAWILARHYKTVVNILRPINRYKVKTPDFQIDEEFYELKNIVSPKVDQLTTQLGRASKQAKTIVINGAKSKIHDNRIREICETFARDHKNRWKIIQITKLGKVVDIN